MSIIKELERLNIQLRPGIGFFCLDFGAYFPYVNQNILDMDVTLSTESMQNGAVINLREQSVLNHRYPNFRYVTLSQKFGRKLCKTGCIIQCSHEELAAFKYINITYAIGKHKPVQISIPIDMNTSDERSCVAMEIHYRLENPSEPDFSIRIYEKQSNGGWKSKIYGIKNPDEADQRFDYVQLTPVKNINKAMQSDYIVYGQTIKLMSQRPEDILII